MIQGLVAQNAGYNNRTSHNITVLATEVDSGSSEVVDLKREKRRKKKWKELECFPAEQVNHPFPSKLQGKLC